MPRENYLARCDVASDGPLHLQDWMQAEMHHFTEDMMELELQWCTLCKEYWPVRPSSQRAFHREDFACKRCSSLHAEDLNKFSTDNDMNPGTVPPTLEGLTMVEEMLIARACPIMTIRRLPGG